MNTRRIKSTVAIAALLFAGCAPVVHGGTPEEGAQVLQSWQELLTVRPIRCTLKTVYIVARPGLSAEVTPDCVIRVSREFVCTFPADQVRAALAHEQGHILHHDGGGLLGNNRPQIERERLADIEAAHTLSMISPEACLALPRLFTTMAARSGGVESPKHPPFSERIATTEQVCYEERVARGQATR
jgi:hypothetical protein